MKRRVVISLAVTALLAVSLFAAKKKRQGLSTMFSDVILGGLEPGMVYSLKKEERIPYKVINKSDRAYELEVKVEAPKKEELRSGYEAVPDPGWVKVYPERFTLAPGEGSDCDVVISIPNQKEYAKRNYQIFIIAETVSHPESAGIHVGLGLKSRLRFSTGPTPQKTFDEQRRRTLEALKIEIAPFNLYISDVTCGEKVVLGKGRYPTLQVVNRGDSTYKMKFRISDRAHMYGIASGYEKAPDETWLKVRNSEEKVKNRQIKDIYLELDIPDREEYRDKKYAFVVIGDIEGLDIPVNIYSRVYVKTKK